MQPDHGRGDIAGGCDHPRHRLTGVGVSHGSAFATMNRPARGSAQRPFPDCERITDPSRVARLLEQVARHHALLTVDIPGYAERYTSTIVDVDATCVLLDELLPSEGHVRPLAERRLRVTGKLDGIDIRFITTLVRVDERDGMITCQACLPG
jgi:hypothetical protein